MGEPRANASDEEQVRAKQRKAKESLELQRADLEKLLGMVEFRRYLWRQWNVTCGLMTSTAHPNGSQQSLNIGMQDVARKQWAEVEQVDPLAIVKMLQETFEASKK